MFQKEVDSVRFRSNRGFEESSIELPIKSNNKFSKTRGQKIKERFLTVFCSVCIILFGIASLTHATPGSVVTSIGENISTNSLSLTGAITSGSWLGDIIDIAHGGTGQNWLTAIKGSIPFFSDTGTMSTLNPGNAGQVLTSGGADANPSWSTATRSATFVIAASDSAAKSKQQADYVCDGTDDNVEIQAAIDALPANGGSILLLEGTFVLDAPNAFYVNNSRYSLNLHGNNVDFVGSRGTILKLKDGINVGNGAANTFVTTLVLMGNNLSVRNIYFNNNSGNVSADYNIAIWHGSDGFVSRYADISYNYFTNQKKWAIWGDGGSFFWNVHDNNMVSSVSGGGIAFHNGPSYSQISNNVIVSVSTGIFIDSLSSVQITGNYIMSPSLYGIESYDSVNYCTITNNIIENYSGTPSAIFIHTKNTVASTSLSTIIQGNSMHNIPNGIVLSDSYVQNASVINNTFTSVATPISNSGTGTIIKNNVGYTTENSGTVTVATGGDSVTVNHGLAATPTRVQLTPTSATGVDYWVSDKTATTFTINLSAAAADISFDWRATVGEGN